MKTNLQPFYAVHRGSGDDHYIFCTQAEAEAAIESWNKELDQLFEKWLAGNQETSDSLMQSNLEANLEGGCYNNYIINPAWRPGGWIRYEIGQASWEVWQDAVGTEKISWGNPATVRPQKNNRVLG